MKYVLALLSLGLIVSAVYTTSAPAGSGDILVLSEANTVSLNLPIDNSSAKDIQIELMEKSEKLSKNAAIYLVLNSPGGSIDAGKNIIETAKGIPNPIHTVSLFSASMSFILSQRLGTRYVLDSTTMMSHRASAGGLEGQLPGSLVTRTLAVLNEVTELEQMVATRAGLKLDVYQRLIADEMWITGRAAMNTRFADRLVSVRCDKTMNGPGKEHVIDLVFLRARVTFHKCPLITAPVSVALDRYTSDSKEAFLQAVYDRPGFLQDIVRTHKFEQVWR